MKALKDEQVDWIFIQAFITYAVFCAKGWIVALLANIIAITLIIAAIKTWSDYVD